MNFAMNSTIFIAVIFLNMTYGCRKTRHHHNVHKEHHFTCPERDGMFSKPGSNRYVYHCREGVPTLTMCPIGMVFDGIDSCVHPFRCPQPNGMFRHPSDERQYYYCWHDLPHPQRCPDRTLFDGKECSPDTSITICSVQEYGIFVDPNDRQNYIQCWRGRARLGKCPEHTVFDNDIQSCVHQIDKDDNDHGQFGLDVRDKLSIV